MAKPIEDMTEPELGKLMTAAADAVKRTLPRRALFTVLVWGEDGIAQYISNCQRGAMVRALRETADRLERRDHSARIDFPGGA